MSDAGAPKRDLVRMLKARSSTAASRPRPIEDSGAGAAAAEEAAGDASRIAIRENGTEVSISNPTRRYMPVVLFLLLWLGGWGMGELFAIGQLFGGSPGMAGPFLALWLTGWSIAGVVVWWIVLRQLFGVEKLFIRDGSLTLEKGVWILRRRRTWPLAQVSNIRLFHADDPGPRSRLAGGAIAFDTRHGTRSFGSQMDSAEARAACAAIRRHVAPAATARTR